MAERGFTIQAEDVEAALGRGVLRAAERHRKVGVIEPPTCTRCGREVDRFTAEEDHAAAMVSLTASCHGETESVEMTFQEVVIAPSFRMGLAFAGERAVESKRLEAGGPAAEEGEDG